MIGPTPEAIEQARAAGAEMGMLAAVEAGDIGDVCDAASDAACRELLGYLSDIACATDLDGVLAEISALQRALGGE